ncbi:3-hydroxyacyl-CoA dehydrogenase family protein [Microbacterium saperdae]|uniref:3-hydroxybutyryl-CoA dehydrogenase n=1 Tax=Microbacterium saperdae TaxID=69368 RepID=A0A543BQ48_9MICO|nr:3-hydroxyacyl-CoA dehydrogenase family protein [Microbacterium saperdae]TQL86951.1 3-hydroxybutyryl-CoA dehydrogenase [Microbacterium saperdae]GGM44014.1 3-hydroxybutyryl-CoA dehydrogenase [Microbacterium saperdae]
MSLPQNVGVLGGGRMGAGIAHAFLLAGVQVHVVERDEESADAARQRIETSLGRSVARGGDTLPLDELTSALTVGTSVGDFAQAGLVIEAVPEDRTLKAEALSRIEAVVAGDAVLATNTSSISITDLAGGLTFPERFLGMHFFNPVPSSTLIEVVIGARTLSSLVDTLRGWVAELGKTAVVVRDSPGFASSRLGVMLALEAIRMLEEGVASAADIDAAMELGYRHPTGPLRTTDIVGLDVRLGIAEELERAFGDRFAPPALLRRMVDDGQLGRKSGRGFYDWSDER